jgi:hypothetical protein
MKKMFLTLLILMSLLIWSLSTVYGSANNIADADFTINVSDITPGSGVLIWDGAGETIDNLLLTILEKLIVVFGVLAIFTMTIGAWYMIIYHGQDEFLSKWKTIFIWGILALAVALSAWVIVKLFAYLLY